MAKRGSIGSPDSLQLDTASQRFFFCSLHRVDCEVYSNVK